MAISEDASTPVVTHGASGTSTTWSTGAFSPPANSLVVVPCAVDWSGTPAATTVSLADSGSVSYSLGPSNFTAAAHSISAIFTHYYTAAPGSITLTLTRSGDTTTADASIAPRVLLGAAFNQAGAGSTQTTGSSGTNLEATVTTTQPGSWVYAAAMLVNNPTLTADAQTTTIDVWADTETHDIAIGRSANPTSTTPGATTFGWTFSATAHSYTWVGLEILPWFPPGPQLIGQAVKRAAYW